MKEKKPDCYTLVQAYSFTDLGKPQFSRGVESYYVSSSNKKQLEQIEKYGGFVFHDWKSADDAEHKVNYPDPDYKGLAPRIQGSFHTSKSQVKFRIYIPTKEERTKILSPITQG